MGELAIPHTQQCTNKKKGKKIGMTSEGIEPPIFGSGIRRVAIAP
jgi:hypothetical protein